MTTDHQKQVTREQVQHRVYEATSRADKYARLALECASDNRYEQYMTMARKALDDAKLWTDVLAVL